MSINKKEEQSEVNSDYSTNDNIFSHFDYAEIPYYTYSRYTGREMITSNQFYRTSSGNYTEYLITHSTFIDKEQVFGQHNRPSNEEIKNYMLILNQKIEIFQEICDICLDENANIEPCKQCKFNSHILCIEKCIELSNKCPICRDPLFLISNF